MTARPVYVVLIGWLLIVVGVLSIISVGIAVAAPSLIGTPPSTLGIGVNLLCSIVQLVCGLYVLRGENWSRFAYLLLSVASTFYLFLAGSVDATILIVWCVFVVLTNAGLFTPAASRFFARAAPEPIPDAAV